MARPLRVWQRCRPGALLLLLRRGGSLVAARGSSTQPARLPRMEYQEDAVCTLNTLQTNASYLEQVKRERGQPQMQLQAMRTFLQRSGLAVEDLDQLNIIHVTGTKGKGSTCAFTERILRNCGLRTGFYSSPHLVQVRERIRINGQPISKELFTKYFWQVYGRLDETKDSHYGSMPAYFRFLTILAFHVFLQEKVLMACTSVGGEAEYMNWTRILNPSYADSSAGFGLVPSAVSFPNPASLKVALAATPVFFPLQPGVPAFTVKQLESPMNVLKARAEEIGCSLQVCPDLEEYESGGERLRLGLEGDHQRSNASLALQLCSSWLRRRGIHDFISVPKRGLAEDVPLNSPFPKAASFKPSPVMVNGLQSTEWPGRTQTLRHGPVTYFLDGAHTMRSMLACVSWFRDAAARQEKTTEGPVVRVLLFNATGERDSAAMLKLLVPFHFEFAVFCPNITEAVSSSNADQHNFNVTVENMLTRCLDNQKSWRRLAERDSAVATDVRIPEGLPLVAETRQTDALVFPCILSALQWICQGRDPVLDCPGTFATLQPGATTRAEILREAAGIHVLVTGSLHLVGGVLKHLDPSLSS
uniref:tetrahydrofolate synthase n=1 Tax=Lepisosteus oculatus TaxID=7918 RepID=W5MDF7_LEPOC